MAFSRLLPVLLLVSTAIAHPTPADDPAPDSARIQTSFTHVGCSQEQIDILNQNVNDAVALAAAGLDYINDELVTKSYPQYGHRQVDFSKQAAIDFFGPESKNAPYQQHIFDTVLKAANAYPGWGLSDWWNDRYVTLSCKDEANACDDSTAAYFSPGKRDYGYPLVTFCNAFFATLQSHADVVKKIDQDPNLQQNVANMRSRATTFLHELLHINWGTAQECAGKTACTDHKQDIGGKLVRSYKTGRAKLLAHRDVQQAAWNNDNYAYYSMVKFMEKRWKKYPKYPSRWDPTKSREENEKREETQPGAPPKINSLEGEDLIGGDSDAPAVTDPLYPEKDYPYWYKPLVTAPFDDPSPDVSQPRSNNLTYKGPNLKDVVCETSDGSPEIEHCGYAFGSLKSHPNLGSLQGGKKGETWWAGYVHSCALALYYTEDWADDCVVTLKEIDDHVSAIYEKCQNPGNGKVGGRVFFGKEKCNAQMQIIKTEGKAPQGLPP